MVVAATLLDLKAARLIPSGEVEDPEDLALLEARDLLFARLMQYRAFQRVAAYLAATLQEQGRRFPREVDGAAFRPADARSDNLDQPCPARRPGREGDGTEAGRSVLSPAHMHAPVSVREQAEVVVNRLRRQRAMTFRP